MCDYCEKQKEIKSCNLCGAAKAVIVGDEIEKWPDLNNISRFNDVFIPSFKINFCPMCGRKLSEDN